MAITTHEHHGHGDHGHDHEGAAGPHTHLTSVGIDIGSSTSHLMFSRLLIGYPSVLQRKPVVLERNVIARSPILLTPFSGDWNIEAGPLKDLVDATFKDAGLTRDEIDTGAVIITGEAARRDNARKIAELFADDAGRFVCATAGPALETIMAAHGSGAVARSRDEGLTILNIDVGGGTTKVSVIENGRIRATAAVNIDPRESDTRPLAVENLKPGAGALVSVIRDEEDLLLAGKTRPLWPALAATAALMLALEMLLLARASDWICFSLSPVIRTTGTTTWVSHGAPPTISFAISPTTLTPRKSKSAP